MNKTSLLIILLLLTIIAIGVLLYYPILNSFALFSQIKQDYNNSSKILSTGAPLATFAQGYDFEKFAANTYLKYEFLITDPNPIFPTVVILYDDHGDENDSEVDILKLQRSGLTTFSYISQTGLEIRNKSFEEAKDLVKKHDLTKENPDPVNIVIYQSPTKADVEKRDEAEKTTKIKENLRLKYLDKLFLPSLNKDEKKTIATEFLNQYKTAETQILQNPETNVTVIESVCTPEFRNDSLLRLCRIDVMIDELQTGIEKLNRGEDAFVITEEYLKQINYFNVAR